jgi:septum formation protein
MARQPFAYPDDFLLFLASRSPRRQELLTAAGIPHIVVGSRALELTEGTSPRALAEANAQAKARGAELPSSAPGGAFVLSADTIVVVGDAILGKPSSKEEAVEMLTALSGRRHEVISGVCLARADDLRDHGDCILASAATAVEFRRLTPPDIEAYAASEEWRGKAGAYAVQGRAALFVSRIDGDYSNVVGLPLALVAGLFKRFGFDLLQRRWCDGR